MDPPLIDEWQPPSRLYGISLLIQLGLLSPCDASEIWTGDTSVVKCWNGLGQSIYEEAATAFKLCKLRIIASCLMHHYIHFFVIESQTSCLSCVVCLKPDHGHWWSRLFLDGVTCTSWPRLCSPAQLISVIEPNPGKNHSCGHPTNLPALNTFQTLHVNCEWGFGLMRVLNWAQWRRSHLQGRREAKAKYKCVGSFGVRSIRAKAWL